MAGFSTGNYYGSSSGGNSRGGYGGGRGPSGSGAGGNRGTSGGYGSDRGYGNRQGTADTSKPHIPLDGNRYVDTAENVIKALRGKKGGLLTTSKIRNLLSMISSLYDEVRRERSDRLSQSVQSRIQYIRLHFAYEAGRDQKVKEFVTEADIFAHLKDIGESKEKFLLFCRYMEALVAYHRFYEGKE